MKSTTWRNIGVVMVILFVGVAIFGLLTATRSTPDRKPKPSVAPIVEVQSVRMQDVPVVVEAMGSITPARAVSVTPQVSGRVIWISDELIPGGQVESGAPLVKIDPADYDLAIRQAKAAVAQARLALEEQKGQQAAAKRELQMLDSDLVLTPEGQRLAGRETYVENAQAQLDAALSNLEQAQLARQRTVIRAPFSARVREKSVDIGQVVGTQSVLAQLVDSSHVWVEASLPLKDLTRIDVPGVNAEAGSSARIIRETGAAEGVVRQGRVLRLLPDLQQSGKLAQLLIEVDNPFGTENAEKTPADTKEAAATRLPLLVGAFVKVEIFGHTLSGLFALPRVALREGDQVWLRTSDGLLSVRDVEVAYRDEHRAYVASGLEEGDAVVVSPIPVPVPGMKLKLAGEAAKSDKPGKAGKAMPGAGPQPQKAGGQGSARDEQPNAEQRP